MPWKEIKPMDEKVLFISDCIRDLWPFAEVCRRHGISRKTGYKWLNRYQSMGLTGLSDQSRRPHGHARQIPYNVRQRIVQLRTESALTPGAKKIHAQLVTELGEQDTPCLSSINQILKDSALVKPRRKRRYVSRYPHPLRAGQEANELWSVDFKGQFKLYGGGPWCYPLTVMDDYSRFLIGNACQKSVQTPETQASFEKLFREFGLPRRIRSDNGVPFASKATAGLSRLSAWWIRLGIMPERIEPGKPQQNGKHERMHRTLKWAALPSKSPTFEQQQVSLDEFRYHYNYERPHEALSQQTPASRYCESLRAYPEHLPEVVYPGHFTRLTVRPSGTVYWGNGQVYISHILAGEPIGLEEVADGLFDAYYAFYRIGQFDIRDNKNNVRQYWTLKA